jgi:hypothetical protein
MYINVYICKTYACVCIYIKEVWEIEEEESGVGTRPGADQAPRAGVMGWLEVFFFLKKTPRGGLMGWLEAHKFLKSILYSDFI